MGWFDEQIKQRIKNDNDAFSEAFEKMACSVMGRSALTELMNNKMRQSQNAIEETLRYYHIKPQEVSTQLKDMSEQLEYQLRPHGIMYRNVTLRDKWYKDGIGIMIGSTVSGDIVALVPSGVSGYKYLDHSKGKYVKITKKNEKNISREAICFYNPLPLKKLNIKELIKYLAKIPSLSDISVIVLITLAVTVIGLLIPKVNNLIFKDVVVSSNKMFLIASMTLLAGVTISSSLANVIKSILIGRVQTKTDVAVEAASMMRILTLPSDFFKKYSSGDIGSRMQSLGTLCGLIGEVVLTVGLSSLFSLLYIVQIFRYADALVLPALMITLITFAFTVISSFVQMNISKEKMELQAKEHGLVYSIVSGVAKIKLAGAEKRIFAKWSDTYTKSAELTYSPPAIIKYNSVITTAISLIGSIFLYSTAIKNGVSVADYMAFNSAYAMVSGAFATLSSVALKAADVKPILNMAKPIMETVPEIAESKKTISKLSGGIELNHISFRYSESMPLVIDDLSLKIRPGQYVAIVGSTGCGKSTLMRIMLGFEKPMKGSVYYDGKDLSSLDLKSVRKKIGVVMQNGKLFQGDIFSNIAISAPNLTLEQAWEVAKMTGIDEDIRNMPMGMNTLISEGNGGISGGQRQRLMIARAIAPNPKILMFDEATSALDNITQKIVSDSLDKLKCTRIVIAHRLSTIKQCDRIVVLDKGKIIEDGTYDELIAKKGFFAELVERQQVNMPLA